MNIVIVEDEIRIREGIHRLLQKLNKDYVVTGEAENGRDGLALILKERPDIVITDVKMPLMDGLEMLEELHRENYLGKAIVLSAYSEFEYARSAMRLGVTEYLLKPVALADFTQSLKNVTEQIERERERAPEQVGSLNQLLKNILYDNLQLDGEIVDYIDKNYDFKDDMKVALLTEHYECWDERLVRTSVRQLTDLLQRAENLHYSVLEDTGKHMLHLILYGYRDMNEIKRKIQYLYLNTSPKDRGISRCWTEVDNIYQIRQQYGESIKYLEWNISIGDDVLISYPEIRNVQTALCIYPVQIENDMKSAVCANDMQKVQRSAARFHKYFSDDKVYRPKEIKECYVRFFWSVINYAKEIYSMPDENLNQQQFLEEITQAKTKFQLLKVTNRLMADVYQYGQHDTENIVIRRALSMIHEYYRSGITLEEIAARLNLTPKYLGTQFHREMNMTFSTYMKNYRINKAKELLLGTQLKLYQIAEQTGYADPKYFSKVFKDVTGYLPAEYRKLHR